MKVATALADCPNGWVACGHYSQVRDLLWPAADTIIWLDYPLTVVLPRVVARTFHRCLSGEELWNGNRERFWIQLTSRDSILLWVLTSYRRRKYQYPRLLGAERELGKRVLRFTDPARLDRWLASITPPAATAAAVGSGMNVKNCGPSSPPAAGAT
jgi:hypothetical protein